MVMVRDDLFEGYFEDVPIEFTPDQARQWQKQAQIYAKQFKLNIQIIEDEIAQRKRQRMQNLKQCKNGEVRDG